MIHGPDGLTLDGCLPHGGHPGHGSHHPEHPRYLQTFIMILTAWYVGGNVVTQSMVTAITVSQYLCGR